MSRVTIPMPGAVITKSVAWWTKNAYPERRAARRQTSPGAIASAQGSA